jgi:hypothetical protein
VKLVERIEREQTELHASGQVEFAIAPVYEQEQPKIEKDAAGNPLPLKNPQYKDYVVTGTFNPITGKFQKDDSTSHFASKGIPSDRDERMLNY